MAGDPWVLIRDRSFVGVAIRCPVCHPDAPEPFYRAGFHFTILIDLPGSATPDEFPTAEKAAAFAAEHPDWPPGWEPVPRSVLDALIEAHTPGAL